MSKAKKKTMKEERVEKAAELDELLKDGGPLHDKLWNIHSTFCNWHAEQNHVPIDTQIEWISEGPMAAVKILDKAIREARKVFENSSAVEWCSTNGYKE
jgi:hypothetical protein